MTYKRLHHCYAGDCKTYTAYIRKNNKWTPVGNYHTECKTFAVLDGTAKNTTQNNAKNSKPLETNVELDSRSLLREGNVINHDERKVEVQSMYVDDPSILINSLS